MRQPDVELASLALWATFGDALRIDAVIFRTGAIAIYVRRGADAACIRTNPDNAEWSYSVGLDPAGDIAEPDHVAGSLEQAIEGIAAHWPDGRMVSSPAVRAGGPGAGR